MSSKADVSFLFEIGALRYVDRTWRQFLGADFANVSEHTFRVLWTSLVLGSYEKDVDSEKLLKMALVHDIGESRTGDVHYVSRLYTTRNEELAIDDMIGKTSLKNFSKIWREYEKFDCIEAKIVKDADTLDIELELREQQAKGISLKNLWKSRRRKEVYGHKLFTKTAKRFWDLIEKSDPHDWHYFGRNRHTAGDWKPN